MNVKIKLYVVENSVNFIVGIVCIYVINVKL